MDKQALQPGDVGPNAAILVHFASDFPGLVAVGLDHIAAGGDVVPRWKNLPNFRQS